MICNIGSTRGRLPWICLTAENAVPKRELPKVLSGDFRGSASHDQHCSNVAVHGATRPVGAADRSPSCTPAEESVNRTIREKSAAQGYEPATESFPCGLVACLNSEGNNAF